MPDLASILVRRSVGALSSGQPQCHSCRRTPLAGERLSETDGGRHLCELCVVETHASGHVISVHRVHASERQLPVRARIAA